MATEVLTREQLHRLKEHKYRAEGVSLCEPFMQVFWRWLVEQIPRTWAPNTITLIGLIVNIVSTLILVYYSPDGTQEAPSWVYILCAVGLFIYQSLDAIDGKQARRTKSNSPLGELFDHGCDSVSTVFVMTGCCVALRIGQDPWLLFFEIIVSQFCFYMAHWQTYVTGVLRFGMVDVTEGQFTVIAIHLVSSVYPALWDYQLPVPGLAMRHLVALGSWLPSLVHIVRSSSVILQGGVGKNKSTVAGTSTIFPAVPIGLVIVLQSIIAGKTSIYTSHPCLYLLSFGIVASKVTNALVVAHMTKNEIFLIDSCFIGPLMLFLNQYFNCIINEYFLLWIMCVYCSWDIVQYSVIVCRQICDSLNIYCFDITSVPRQQPEKKKSNGKQQATK